MIRKMTLGTCLMLALILSGTSDLTHAATDAKIHGLRVYLVKMDVLPGWIHGKETIVRQAPASEIVKAGSIKHSFVIEMKDGESGHFSAVTDNQYVKSKGIDAQNQPYAKQGTYELGVWADVKASAAKDGLAVEGTIQIRNLLGFKTLDGGPLGTMEQPEIQALNGTVFGVLPPGGALILPMGQFKGQEIVAVVSQAQQQ